MSAPKLANERMWFVVEGAGKARGVKWCWFVPPILPDPASRRQPHKKQSFLPEIPQTSPQANARCGAELALPGSREMKSRGAVVEPAHFLSDSWADHTRVAAASRSSLWAIHSARRNPSLPSRSCQSSGVLEVTGSRSQPTGVLAATANVRFWLCEAETPRPSGASGLPSALRVSGRGSPRACRMASSPARSRASTSETRVEGVSSSRRRSRNGPRSATGQARRCGIWSTRQSRNPSHCSMTRPPESINSRSYS